MGTRSSAILANWNKAVPRLFNPVKVRRLDERVYEKALRRVLLGPLMARLRAGLSEASTTALALNAITRIFRDAGMLRGLTEPEIAAQASRLSEYHRKRLIQTFRAALGIDIGPVLSDAAIEPLMMAWRAENVSLIRTVPARIHESLLRRLTETFAERPFDQQALSQALRREFGVAGRNLRRITRDQTSKAIGQLTRARQSQAGIKEYTWRTAQDERVRVTHQALEGSRQKWDSPPAVGHPGEDILCRCVAIPVIEGVDG